MKKLVCALLIMIFATGFVLPASAASSVSPVVEIKKYNDSTGKFDLDAATVTQGDLVLVQVAFDQTVPSVATVRVKLEFPSDKVSYVEGSYKPELVSNAQVDDVIFSAKKDYLISFFGKSILTDGTDGAEIAKNATGIISFIFKCDAYEGEVDFKATIDGVLDKNYKDVVLKAKTASKKILLTGWNMSAAERAIFEQLKVIVYAPGEETDSKAAIDAADKIYGSYTAAQKVMFKSKESALFQYYQSAWTRYYDASIEASKNAIQKEVDRFVSENQEALSLKAPEDVTASNYEAVFAAIEAYGKLTAKAQVQALDYKAQLDKLEETAAKFKTQKEADLNAQEIFIDEYESRLWNLEPSMIHEDSYAEFMVVIEEALAVYGTLDHNNMSQSMKEKVATYYNKLQALSNKIDEVIEAVGEEESIREEIAAFTEKWHVVTRLTPLSVGVDDKTAIEMMLADYAQLSETAQKRLESRKTMAEQLLTLIGSYGGIQNNVGGNAGIPVVPSGGTTQEGVKEVIKEVTVENQVTQVLNNQLFRNVPDIVYIMILLMGVSVLTLPLVVGVYLLYRKRKKQEEGGTVE